MNYYEILEISKNATLEVIKAAYKAQISKYHPDNLDGDKDTIQEINREYDHLSKFFMMWVYKGPKAL